MFADEHKHGTDARLSVQLGVTVLTQPVIGRPLNWMAGDQHS